MDITKSKCDNCGIEAETYFHQKGWIQFRVAPKPEGVDASCIIYIETPEIPKKQKLKTVHTDLIPNHTYDFCCPLCFGEFIKTVKPQG
jgi:hypothetical protein